MKFNIKSTDDFQKLLTASSFPSLDLIAFLAKKEGIDDPRVFWEFFDAFRTEWTRHHSKEESWDVP